jgi:hypothetical protein
LREKRESYLALQHTIKDSQGFISDKCDSVGFSCLNVVGGGEIDIKKAQDPDGRLWRHPDRDCYDKGESGSDISRDMIWMCLVYAYHSHDGEFVSRLKSYAKDHNFILGRGDITRTAMTPKLISTLYKVDTALNGSQENPPQSADQEEAGTSLSLQTGFEAHLQVLDIWLNSALEHGITQKDLEILKGQTEREPFNLLFSAMYHTYSDGDMTYPVIALGGDYLYPKGRLPTTEDHCTEYLYQRDYSAKDWGPCDPSTPVKTHSATDFLFALKIVEGGFAPWNKPEAKVEWY